MPIFTVNGPLPENPQQPMSMMNDEPAPKFGDLVQSALDVGAPTYSAITHPQDALDTLNRFFFGARDKDPNFNPMANADQYEPNQWQDLMEMNNQAELDRYNTRTQQVQKEQQTIANAGLPGLIANMGAGLVDPIFHIPYGGAAVEAYANGSNVIEAGLNAARTGTMAMAAFEGVGSLTDPTKTMDDSINNIGAGALLGGAIGAGSATWGHLAENGIGKFANWQDFADKFKSDTTIAPNGKLNMMNNIAQEYRDMSVGAAAKQPEWENFVNKYGGTLYSTNPAFDWFMKGLPNVTPNAIMSTSEIPDVRALKQALSPDMFAREGEAESPNSIHVFAQQKNAEMAVTVDKILSRAQDWAKGNPEEGFNLDNFKSDVTKMARRQAARIDDLPDTPYNQEVRRAASDMKDFYTKYEKQMSKNGFSTIENYGAPILTNPVEWVKNRDEIIPKLHADLLDQILSAKDRLDDFNEKNPNPEFDEEGNLKNPESYQGDYEKDQAKVRATDPEIRQEAENFYNKLAYGNGGNFIYRDFNKDIYDSPRFSAREFFTGGKEIKYMPYLNNDMADLMQTYTRQVSPKLGEAEILGRGGIADALKKTFGDGQTPGAWQKAMQGITEPVELAKMKRRMDLEKQATETMIANIDGSIVARSVLTRAERDVIQGMSSIAALNVGMAAISSVSEVGAIAMTHGWRGIFGDGLSQIMKETVQGRLAELQDITGATSLIHAKYLTNMGGSVDSELAVSKFTQGANKFANGFMKLTGTLSLNNFAKELAFLTGEQKMFRASLDSVATDVNPRDMEIAKTLGLNLDDLQQMGKVLGQDPENLKGGIINPIQHPDGTYGAFGPDLADKFQTAMFKASSQAGLHTATPGEIPAVLQGDVGNLFRKYRNYIFSANARVLQLGLQRADAEAMQGAVMMVALGAMSVSLKAALTGRKMPDNPSQLIYEAIDNTGMMGLPGFALNALEIPRIAGLQPSGGRWSAAESAVNVLGPAAGGLANVMAIPKLAEPGGFNKENLRQSLDVIPGNNFIGVNQLKNYAINSATGKSQ